MWKTPFYFFRLLSLFVLEVNDILPKCEICRKNIGGFLGQPEYKWKEKTVCLWCFLLSQINEVWNQKCPLCDAQKQLMFNNRRFLVCASCFAEWNVSYNKNDGTIISIQLTKAGEDGNGKDFLGKQFSPKAG